MMSLVTELNQLVIRTQGSRIAVNREEGEILHAVVPWFCGKLWRWLYCSYQFMMYYVRTYSLCVTFCKEILPYLANTLCCEFHRFCHTVLNLLVALAPKQSWWKGIIHNHYSLFRCLTKAIISVTRKVIKGNVSFHTWYILNNLIFYT